MDLLKNSNHSGSSITKNNVLEELNILKKQTFSMEDFNTSFKLESPTITEGNIESNNLKDICSVSNDGGYSIEEIDSIDHETLALYQRFESLSTPPRYIKSKLLEKKIYMNKLKHLQESLNKESSVSCVENLSETTTLVTLEGEAEPKISTALDLVAHAFAFLSFNGNSVNKDSLVFQILDKEVSDSETFKCFNQESGNKDVISEFLANIRTKGNLLTEGNIRKGLFSEITKPLILKLVPYCYHNNNSFRKFSDNNFAAFYDESSNHIDLGLFPNVLSLVGVCFPEITTLTSLSSAFEMVNCNKLTNWTVPSIVVDETFNIKQIEIVKEVNADNLDSIHSTIQDNYKALGILTFLNKHKALIVASTSLVGAFSGYVYTHTEHVTTVLKFIEELINPKSHTRSETKTVTHEAISTVLNKDDVDIKSQLVIKYFDYIYISLRTSLVNVFGDYR